VSSLCVLKSVRCLPPPPYVFLYLHRSYVSPSGAPSGQRNQSLTSTPDSNVALPGTGQPYLAFSHDGTSLILAVASPDADGILVYRRSMRLASTVATWERTTAAPLDGQRIMGLETLADATWLITSVGFYVSTNGGHDWTFQSVANADVWVAVSIVAGAGNVAVTEIDGRVILYDTLGTAASDTGGQVLNLNPRLQMQGATLIDVSGEASTFGMLGVSPIPSTLR